MHKGLQHLKNPLEGTLTMEASVKVTGFDDIHIEDEASTLSTEHKAKAILCTEIIPEHNSTVSGMLKSCS